MYRSAAQVRKNLGIAFWSPAAALSWATLSALREALASSRAMQCLHCHADWH